MKTVHRSYTGETACGILLGHVEETKKNHEVTCHECIKEMAFLLDQVVHKKTGDFKKILCNGDSKDPFLAEADWMVTCKHCLKKMGYAGTPSAPTGAKVHMRHVGTPSQSICRVNSFNYVKTEDSKKVTCKSCLRKLDIDNLPTGQDLIDAGLAKPSTEEKLQAREKKATLERKKGELAYYKKYRKKNLWPGEKRRIIHMYADNDRFSKCQVPDGVNKLISHNWDDVTCKFCLKRNPAVHMKHEGQHMCAQAIHGFSVESINLVTCKACKDEYAKHEKREHKKNLKKKPEEEVIHKIARHGFACHNAPEVKISNGTATIHDARVTCPDCRKIIERGKIFETKQTCRDTAGINMVNKMICPDNPEDLKPDHLARAMIKASDIDGALTELVNNVPWLKKSTLLMMIGLQTMTREMRAELRKHREQQEKK